MRLRSGTPEHDLSRTISWNGSFNGDLFVNDVVASTPDDSRPHDLTTSVAYAAIVRPMSAGDSRPLPSTGSLPRSRKYST